MNADAPKGTLLRWIGDSLKKITTPPCLGEALRRESIVYSLIFINWVRMYTFIHVSFPLKKKHLLPDCPVFQTYYVNRYLPLGTLISNRAPSPGSPVSMTESSVIARISEARKRPYPEIW
jgi:hypothetical protein